ncbi:MAG: helix-turn-helix domain-containing protein [Fibromonadaceae bacterium]|jgi:putative transcriptional regulator|nr:helix-turn-helix domain-containing protein [Fibromonadaceae bacterium]
MKQEHFSELAESVKEMNAICKGQKTPSREFVYEEHEIKSIRERYGLTQNQFAQMIGISTLQNWEIGRRKPYGAARVLLRVMDKYPKAMSSLMK